MKNCCNDKYYSIFPFNLFLSGTSSEFKRLHHSRQIQIQTLQSKSKPHFNNPLKTSENYWFSLVFRRVQNKTIDMKCVNTLNIFKFNNNDTRINPNDVLQVSLLLTLNTFSFVFQCLQWLLLLTLKMCLPIWFHCFYQQVSKLSYLYLLKRLNLGQMHFLPLYLITESIQL